MSPVATLTRDAQDAAASPVASSAAAASGTATAPAPASAATPAPAPTPELAHWAVSTRNGLTMMVPPSLHSMSTYVLLEQETWFEPEMSLLPRLLAGGVHALDIGANHGVVALEMARCSGSGHVWAFEPTQAPREALHRSLRVNGLQQRVTVVPAALADAEGEAHFEVHDNSELNARVGNTDGPRPNSRTETVRVDTLDHALQTLGVTQPIGFIKLDAEGDELRVLAGARQFLARQSPVVMFEFKHGAKPNWPLLRALGDLHFGLFRWSAELELMLPFDADTAETAFALNLLALRPPEQAHWAARGLLVTPQALSDAARPALPAAEPGFAAARMAVDAAAPGAASAGLTPAQRVLLVIEARQHLLQATAADADLPAWVLLVHCLYALGQPLAALQMGSQLLAQADAALWQADMPDHSLPPLRAQATRQRSTATGLWLRQMLAEFVALHSAHSSYFELPSPQRWAALLEHPDHGAEIERRYLLSHVVTDRLAPLSGLQKLKHLQALQPGGDLNATLWCGLMQSMRVMSAAAAGAAGAAVPVQPAHASQANGEPTALGPACAASGAATGAGLPGSPEQVLQMLPVASVAIVDVGASELSSKHTPYAALMATGLGWVTGFEPDAEALAALKHRHGDGRRHCYFPHVVGDGRPATFHETHWSLTASLLEPNRAQLDRYHELGQHVVVKSRQPVPTVRLDDVLAPGGMDLLKIDVQGAERLVFDGARARLDECLMVWTEVEFVPLYQHQPLFGDIDERLREHGLQFLCFAGLAQRALASWPVQALKPQSQQQLWADALYVPTAERIARLTPEAAARLALLAHHVARAWDLCHAALLRVDEVSGSDFAAHYLAASSPRR